MAEQDRYGGHFSGKLPSASEVADRLPRMTGSGAEQDRYGAHFDDATSRLPSARDVAGRIPRMTGPGAEQDVYGRWFGGHGPSLRDLNLKNRLPHASGAEQDRFGSHFGSSPTNPVNATAVGLLQAAVLPSFGFHAGLSAVAYGVSRYVDRAEGKDWLWPTGMVANAWWSAIGTRVVYDGLSVTDAWSTLGYSEKLLLGGVSAWGLRLFYRIATRSVARGKDDPRYETAKKDPDFWNKAALTSFLPEAVAQTLISLPFTLAFRAGPAETGFLTDLAGWEPVFHDIALFLFSSGFALEVVADAQLASHKQQRRAGVNRQGVWSLVRHPNYLGDALIHASFPLLLLGAGLLHPIALVGPVLNYAFLRFVGGDAENEASQEDRYAKESPAKHQQFEAYKSDKNSFWPALEEIKNEWTWVIVGAGVAGVVVERGLRTLL